MPKEAALEQPAAGSEQGQREAGRTRRSADISKERILDAALSEFAAYGYEGATTASIARRVGVTQPLIHYHFGSKSALWKAVAARAFTQLGERVTRSLEESSEFDALVVLRILARHVVGFIAENREFSRLMLTEPAFDTPRLDWLVEEHFRLIYERCERLCRAAQDVELLKPIRPDHLMFAFLGAASVYFDCEPLRKRLYHGRLDPPEEAINAYADALVELFARGVSLRTQDLEDA